jgi:hypothetical protein
MVVDRRDPETLLIRRQEQAARPKPLQPSHAWPPSQFVPAPPRRSITPGSSRPMRTHATQRAASSAPAVTPTAPSSAPQGGGNGHVVHGRAIKATIVLDPDEIVTIPTPDGVPRCQLRVDVAGRVLMADISAKSMRRAIATIREHGADGIACILQGKLIENRIDECGLLAQPKAKPAPETA